METWMIEALKIIISLVITVSVILITRYVIPKIKEEIGAEKFNKIVDYVSYAVNAAEQIFKETGLGEKKKEYVLNFINEQLNKLNYSITEEELNVLIESAVKDMNDAKEMMKTSK